MFTFLTIAALLAFASSKPTLVRQLQTEHYHVVIREFCPHDFDCDHVEYTSVSTSGKTIALRGSHIWHNCPGTNDPCHPLGYEFKNHGIIYFVNEDGQLVVSQGPKILVNEKGKWDDE